MIEFDEAIDRICGIPGRLGVETVAIEAAAGRVLARPVVARLASPRRDVSAMDGYAVRDGDLEALPATLRIVGEAFAGAGWQGAIKSGQCVRIFTGASVPDGADRVVIQEEVRREENTAIFDRLPGSARHIRARASDFEKGEELLSTGRFLNQRAIVLAAAADVSKVDVFTRPTVSILSTGDELAAPGTAFDRPDAVPDSVSLGVAALAQEWGADVAGRKRLRDDLPSMESAAATAVQASNLVVVTGGASVGEKDFAKNMFEPLGLELIFSKVAIKPGKPVWLGRCRDTWILGLPGNPTSALVTARLFLVPLLAGLSGMDARAALQWRKASLSAPLPACGGRETFHRARWEGDRVAVLAFQDSSAQKVLAEADTLVRQRANAPAVNADAAVEVLDF